MATGIVITVAEKLFSVLTSQELKEICSVFGYETQLEELASTVSTIKAVLLDAESKHQELTHAGREYVERLKDAVYDVDDVIDEFNTMVQKVKYKNGGKSIKKVRRFFSRSNLFLVALNMSREIRKLREKLDSIAKNRQQFGFSDVYVPVKRRQETGSYAREESIIGRDADKEAIVGVLLGESDHIQDNIAFVTIVGMGGLGKTALAQLVYNDNKIKDAFEVRLWVCVSNEFGMEQIFAKMIGKNAGCGMEELQRDVRNVIEGRKYLLVLDDVWDENHNKWVELRDFLMLGGNGSRVLITTRSKAVARAIGNNHTHELQGLSDEYSWRLFEKMAFEQGKASEDQDLVDIGKKVVKKCANVPLSIRVVGSLLYGQNNSRWLSFISIDFKDLGRNTDGRTEEGIMPILKYSYHHLSPPLKSCFSYCALYPKDFEIREGALIWLWMAHGCLDLSNDGRSIEAVGADYFSILHHRCFFQDNEETNGQTYKMHDLIHDLAQEVAGRETLALETISFQIDKKIRHLAVGNDGCKLMSSHGSCLGEMKQLRSLRHNFDQSFYPTANKSNVNMICSNLRRLRVLDLSFFELTSLPNTLGNLSHLRYLDFSLNHNLEILPESITKLHNLLVLNLTNSGVRELPKGLRNLHNLRHLYLRYCTELTHMPVGMDSMTNLQTLSMFVVAGTNSKHLKIGQLKDLRRLDHLQGRLEILFKSGYPYELANTIEESCLLSNKVYLKDIAIRWEGDHPNECSKGAVHEILLQGLRPHSNIEGIEIRGYKGIEIPSWVVSLATFFPCLVRVSLHGLDGLHNLPSLSELLHLKILSLSSMPNIEFIESNDNTALSDALSTALDELPFFPILEELSLRCLPKLKGVWSDDFLLTKAHKKLFTVQSLPRIRKLEIDDCPCLTGIPRCPGLKTLWLVKVHEYFRFTSIREVPDPISVDPVSPNSFSLYYDSSNDSTFYLKELVIDKVGLVNLLFGESLKGIDDLMILGIRQEIISETADLFQKHASSLRDLTLCDFRGLTSLCGGGIEHLTNLRYLSIEESGELDLGEGEDCGMTPWKSLKNLGQLCLWSLSQLIYLPEGFRHLTSLHTLRICDCNLESLPEWLRCLTSLRLLWLQTCTKLKSLPEAIRHMPSLKELLVWNCELLTDRCREPDGEDWPKISHINRIDIRTDI